MKVAYISTYNSNDVNKWSGLGYHMYKCVADQGVEVVLINSEVSHSKWMRLKSKLVKLLSGKNYEIDRDPRHLKKLAAKAEMQLAKEEYDIVLSPGSLAVTYLNINKPIVFWTDATFDSLVGFYPEYSNLSRETLRHGHEAEQIAINKASLIFYTSHWALENAVRKYHADPHKLMQMPNGPNLNSDLKPETVEKVIGKRQDSNQVNLLFVGVDWVRKGGDIAVETLMKLREKGLNATLTVVGSRNSPEFTSPYIMYHPFVDKNTPEGVKLLKDLYEKATFFVLPTKAECFAVVFAESGSYALPVITSNVGGCESAIINGYNGHCIDLQNFSSTAAEMIFNLRQSGALYRQYSLNAFENFQNNLDWNVVGKKIVKNMKELLK